VEREADLALLDFALYNFEVTTDRSRNPAIVPKAQGSVLLVRFPPTVDPRGRLFVLRRAGRPQNRNVTGLSFDPQPVLSAVSGPSQVAFVFNASNGDEISLPTGTEVDLLDWSGWTLSVPPVA
jgi:hypothetical protein